MFSWIQRLILVMESIPLVTLPKVQTLPYSLFEPPLLSKLKVHVVILSPIIGISFVKAAKVEVAMLQLVFLSKFTNASEASIFFAFFNLTFH